MFSSLNSHYSAGLLKEVCFSCITLLTYVLVGVTRSYIAFLIHQLEFPDSAIILTEEEKSWLLSCVSLLTPIGCLFSGFLMDFLGRKLFLRAAFLPYTVSWYLISFAKNVPTLYVGIALQGFSIGMSFCVATYVAEIASTSRRGALLSILEITHSIGVVICYGSMYYFSWNLVAIGFAAFSTVCLLLTFFLPESPIWLYTKGKKDESIQVLLRLRCVDRANPIIAEEIQDMEKFCADRAKANSLSTISNCFAAWKPLAIVVIMFILMTHTGFLLMVSFIVILVDNLHIPYKGSDVSIMYSISGFVSSCLTPYTIHSFDRKISLALSAFVMAASMASIGIYEEIFYDQEVKRVPWLVPWAVVVYIFAQTLGVYPISFMIGGEVFPNEVRGILNGVYGAVAFGYSTVIFKLFPSFMAFLGVKGTIWSFAISGFLLTLFAIFVLPETRGKTLNEIQEQYFRKKKKTTGDLEKHNVELASQS